MGTRSRIGVMHGDKVKSVYCHWDGYLEHNGQILQDHYNSARANMLVALGDMSSLGPVLGQAHPFSEFGIKEDDPEREAKLALAELAKAEGWCTFYGRDRGEAGTEWQVANTFDEFLEQCDQACAEFYYIMKDGVWYCGTTYENTHPLSKSLTVLSEALEMFKETA
jgi:hypothetical protein